MIDFLTSAVLGGIVYDYVKKGTTVAIADLKQSLKRWLLTDEELVAIAFMVNETPEVVKESETKFVNYLETNLELQTILENAKPVKTKTVIKDNVFEKSPVQLGDQSKQEIHYHIADKGKHPKKS